MKRGDTVREQINVFAPSGISFPKRLTQKSAGTVVYIHPKGRFYTVRFDFPLGAIHESYYFPERDGDSSASRYTYEVRGGRHQKSKKKEYDFCE